MKVVKDFIENHIWVEPCFESALSGVKGITWGPFCKLVPHFKPREWGAPAGPLRESDVCRIWGGRGVMTQCTSDLMATWKIQQAKAGPASFSAKVGGCTGQPVPQCLPGLRCVLLMHQIWGMYMGKPHEGISSLIQGRYTGGTQSSTLHQDGGSRAGSPWSRQQQVRSPVLWSTQARLAEGEGPQLQTKFSFSS